MNYMYWTLALITPLSLWASVEEASGALLKKRCIKVEFPIEELERESVQVLMSLSVADAVWVRLSKEMEGRAGFYLQGMPKDSFQDLAVAVARLRKLGVASPIYIDPRPFVRHSVQTVPCFIKVHQGEEHILRGNVSFEYALKILEGGRDGNNA